MPFSRALLFHVRTRHAARVLAVCTGMIFCNDSAHNSLFQPLGFCIGIAPLRVRMNQYLRTSQESNNKSCVTPDAPPRNVTFTQRLMHATSGGPTAQASLWLRVRCCRSCPWPSTCDPLLSGLGGCSLPKPRGFTQRPLQSNVPFTQRFCSSDY